MGWISSFLPKLFKKTIPLSLFTVTSKVNYVWCFTVQCSLIVVLKHCHCQERGWPECCGYRRRLQRRDPVPPRAAGRGRLPQALPGAAGGQGNLRHVTRDTWHVALWWSLLCRLIVCMMSSSDPSTAGPECFQEFGLDYEPIQVRGQDGDRDRVTHYQSWHWYFQCSKRAIIYWFWRDASRFSKLLLVL